MSKKRSKAKIISELRQKHPLKELLKLSGLARSTYYYYLKQPNTDKYECEKQEIQEIYNANKGRYGYRKTKRNESGTIPNSFTCNLIFNFV